MSELFKSVPFGGYDKEEVLAFIENRLNTIEEHTKQLAEKNVEIENLKETIAQYDERIASALSENQRLTDIITRFDTNFSKEFSKNEIISLLFTAKELKDLMIEDAQNKSEKLLKIAKQQAFQEIKFQTNANGVLENYEKRFKQLMKDLMTMNDTCKLMQQQISDIGHSIDEMVNSLPQEIQE